MNLFSLSSYYKKIVFLTILSFAIIGFFPSTALGATPLTTSIFPDTVPIGSPDTTIAVTGLNFEPGAQVLFGLGATPMPIDPANITPTQILLDIPKSKFATENSFAIIIQNPGGEQSKPPLYLKVAGVAGGVYWSSIIKGALIQSSGGASFASLSPILDFFRTLANLTLDIFRTIADTSGWLLKLVLESITKNENWSITKATASSGRPTFAGAAFLTAWGVVKDWANLLIVLGLLAIALGTMLQWPSGWQAQKLLPSLLLVALLINFSVVFIGLAIDGSNILMANLLGTTNPTEGSDLVLKINQAWDATGRKLPTSSTDQLLEFVSLAATFCLLYILVTIPLLWFAVLFIERYVMLAILFILSPLAFVAFIFPNTRSSFKTWLDKFIKWSFIGLVAAFFLNLSTGILKAFFSTGSASAGGLISGTPVGQVTELLFKLLIVASFMLVGLRILVKADGISKLIMAAGAAIVAAIVTGGASILGSAGGGALKIAGNSKYGQKIKENSESLRNNIKDGYSKFRENIGLDRTGTTKVKQDQRNSAKLKEFESLANAENDEKVLVQRALNANSSAERAAYTKKLIEKKKTHLITDPEDARKIMENAGSYGIDTDEFVKANPNLAKLSSKNITKEKESLVGKETGDKDASGNPILYTQNDISDPNAKYYTKMNNQAERTVKINAIKKMGASHVGALKNIDMDIVSNIKTKTLTEATKTMDANQMDQLDKLRDEARNDYDIILQKQKRFMATPGTATPAEAAKFKSNEEKMKELQKIIDKIDTAIK